ncbi:isochorismatase family protein [Phaeosphaeriaceae sp. PMI808]|nr:isochorismatase family protein [Phaeosphaeriaceae sp. PMI808]
MPSIVPPSPRRKALVGTTSNFWLHSSSTGFDLTHPACPSKPSSGPTLTIKTTTTPITISPFKTALVIVDMQNFFLSPSFGRPTGPGHAACTNLIQYVIPAARKAGIRIIWLNWGLTETSLASVPPAMKRAFGFFAGPADSPYQAGDTAFKGSVSVDRFGSLRDPESKYKALGVECGDLDTGDGTAVEAGRLLMRGSWNAALYPPLDNIYEHGAKLARTPDVWIHKDRMSGLWGAGTECEAFLKKEGIRSLVFAGVSTDHCVGATLMDAFSKGYDCVLLGDGTGALGLESAQKMWEWNCATSFGFVTSCREFSKGVEEMGTWSEEDVVVRD